MSLSETATLSFGSEELQNLDFSLRREWLATNRIGGYASSSLCGANTRRYHGLLVAAMNPPLGRAVLLSKLEESLEIVSSDGTASPSFGLSANIYPNSVYPQGYRHQRSFSPYPCPTWVFEPMPGICVQKRIWMEEGRNTTFISYTLIEAPEGAIAHLHLVPLLAWKDYHSEMHAGDSTPYVQWNPPSQQSAHAPGDPIGVLSVKFPPFAGLTNEPTNLSLHLALSDGTPCPSAVFSHQAYWYYHFQHPRERERGQDSDEDLYSIGMISATLQLGESLTVIATIEESVSETPIASLNALIERQEALIARVRTDDSFEKELTLAADKFIVQVPNVRTTIIAGYPWFCDWGRDTMIALPGLCLTTGRYDIARDILLSYSPFVDQGMLPNRFPDVGFRPEYNTVDATLWYFAALYRYVVATQDMVTLRTLWETLQQIINHHRLGTRYNIHVDTDSLLFAGQPGVQLTWMDSKVGDWVVTPRIGKPVEVNALWYNALKSMAYFAEALGDASASAFETQAQMTSAIFKARFVRQDGLGLYDVIDNPGQPDSTIRPNQIFALSLPFTPINANSDVAKSILKTVEQHLLTPVGLRSLSPTDPEYRPRYEGDTWSRDGAYHQGTIWTWLLGPYAEAHYKTYHSQEIALNALRPLQKELSACGVGSLSEVYDGSEPHRPNGCVAQAWSVGETLRVWKMLQG